MTNSGKISKHNFMRTKKVTQRLNEIDRDLETTEKLFYMSKNETWRQCINKIRYVLIVEMHKLKYSSENIDIDAIEEYNRSINTEPVEEDEIPDPGSRFRNKNNIDVEAAERYYLSSKDVTYKMVAAAFGASFDYIKKVSKERSWYDKKHKSALVAA